ncbi:glycosyltransferase family 2 protein [Zunongwangia endophytica]|uniref:Glycosyltransferase family 2 protein n=1 Tax=Zunongwangia endophytica TaxID=1808945 RepID=A0ABV8H5Y9_9FLAO|nr:glycosyltransferase family 2 protein [Zunongwangia endophytica]MDN3595039.1 glycosyltransferase family 2 protein [Zunongwangia endophytica]
MVDSKLVSIIIPSYNRAHFIGETLDSVIAQTYQNWECIVVDDGSTDYTEELLEFYCHKDVRIQYRHRPDHKPKGANACRNYGFKLSKGQYVIWLDSDDILLEECLMRRVSRIAKTSLDFIFSNTAGLESYSNKTNEQLNLLSTKDNLCDFLYFFASYNLPWWSTLSVTYRREYLLNFSFDENLKRFQDIDFYIQILIEEPSFEHLDLIDNLYRFDKSYKIESVVSSDLILSCFLRLNMKYFKYYTDDPKLRQCFRKFLYKLIKTYLYENNLTFFKFYFKSILNYRMHFLLDFKDFAIILLNLLISVLNIRNYNGIGMHKVKIITDRNLN